MRGIQSNKAVVKMIVSLLITVMMVPPISAAEGSLPLEKRGRSLLGAVLEEVNYKYHLIMKQIPVDLINQIDTYKKIELNAAVEEKVQALKDAAIGVAEFREEMLKVDLEALAQQKRELFYQVQNFSSEKLDKVAERLEGDPNYKDARLEYAAAYTRTEKANAIARALYQDLDHLHSMMNKRSGFMSKEHWIRDLRKVQGHYNSKRYGDGEWESLIQTAVLGILVVGAVTWGVASIIYSGKYDKRENALQAKFDAVRQELEAHYNALETRLTNEELTYLNDNGYVHMTCGSYQLPDSILCNRYSYQLFQGTKYCTVTCYKNAATGKETLHSAPSCTSPFIPADCYDPSEYTRGYSDGYDVGYDDGYRNGFPDGDYDGAYDGYYDGYEAGDLAGYDDGYVQGFYDGYASYLPISISSVRSMVLQSSKNYFDVGYADGQRDAKLLLKLAK